MLGNRIAAAARHVEQSRWIIQRQREDIARLKVLGKDTTHSEKLLALFERTHAIFEKNLRTLLDEERVRRAEQDKVEA